MTYLVSDRDPADGGPVDRDLTTPVKDLVRICTTDQRLGLAFLFDATPVCHVRSGDLGV
jgi:hypothetical protein